MNRRIPIGVDKLSYSLAVHGWLLILSLDRGYMVIGPCGRDVHFLDGLTKIVCKTMLVWPNPKVILPSSNVPRV